MALAEYGATANRSAIRVARDTRWPHPAIHMFGWLKSHFFCFLLLISERGWVRQARTAGSLRSLQLSFYCGLDWMSSFTARMARRSIIWTNRLCEA